MNRIQQIEGLRAKIYAAKQEIASVEIAANGPWGVIWLEPEYDDVRTSYDPSPLKANPPFGSRVLDDGESFIVRKALGDFYEGKLRELRSSVAAMESTMATLIEEANR